MQNYANLDALSRKALLPYDLRPLQQTSPHKSKPGMVWVRVYGWHFDGAARTCLLEAFNRLVAAVAVFGLEVILVPRRDMKLHCPDSA